MLTLRPCTLKKASAFVAAHHRHHRPPQGGLWAVSVEQDGKLVGVAVVGRPVARMLDDGLTAEVTRLCVLEGSQRGAPSMLLGACWRAAKALGYGRMVTYTLPEEGGASLRGAGWREVGPAGGGTWNCPSRPREPGLFPEGVKTRWEVTC